MPQEFFMRPAMCPNPGSSIAANQRAHCELFNPAASGYLVKDITVWISKSTGFCVLGKGAPMLDNASFPDSRGLTIIDGAPRQYSAAHARTKLTTAPAEVIQGGQWVTHDGVTGLIELRFPDMVIGMGTGLMIRSNKDGEPLMVSFKWREDVFGA